MNQLEQIKKFTTVVADTADFESIREFKPQDATTNPSLVYAATQKENYSHFLEEVLADRRNAGLSGAPQLEDIIDHLLVRFGSAMLEIVPGRVSTETDVRYSFDMEGSIRKARLLIKVYEERGVPRERVLIKIASTWEGIMAAEQLQKEGIKCNMTLLFSLPQAVRAAEAKVQLISPFVGRIYDWFKAANKRDYSGAEESFDFRFSGVRTDRTSHALLARARHGEQIAVARIQDSSTCRSVDLSAGAKIYLLKEGGRITAVLTATDRPRPGLRWIQKDDNWSLQNLLVDFFGRQRDWRG